MRDLIIALLLIGGVVISSAILSTGVEVKQGMDALVLVALTIIVMLAVFFGAFFKDLR